MLLLGLSRYPFSLQKRMVKALLLSFPSPRRLYRVSSIGSILGDEMVHEGSALSTPSRGAFFNSLFPQVTPKVEYFNNFFVS